MLNLEKVPAELRDWVEHHLVPEVDGLKAHAGKVEAWAKSHAHYADSVLTAVAELAKVADPAMTPEVTAAVTVAKEAATEAGRLLDDVITKM